MTGGDGETGTESEEVDGRIEKVISILSVTMKAIILFRLRFPEIGQETKTTSGAI